MMRTVTATILLALTVCPVRPAFADDIDSLKGQFAFDWFVEASKARCVVVNDKLISLFKSNAFTCNLDVITNTASGEPARVCTQTAGGAEYLVFQTRKACESERETQASNSEE